MKRIQRAATAPVLGAIILSLTAFAAPANASSDADAVVTGKRERPKASTQLVIAHRGASGYRPEHTLAAYELGARLGADYIEPDLVATKDGVLVVRHENEISGTTDVADRPEFANRKTTKSIDGSPLTGWFTEDFTLAELKTLRAKERLGAVRTQNTIYDGRYEVPTFEEVLKLRARLSKELRREIGIIPEIKHPTYFQQIGLPMEAKTAQLLTKFGLNHKDAPAYIQSFEFANLKELRSKHGFKAGLVFLTWYEGTPFNDKKPYTEYLTPAGLAELSKTVTAIGPEKRQVIALKADGSAGQPTSLVKDAHKAGLQVTPYTVRAENQFLPTNLRVGTDPNRFGKVIDEAQALFRTGVDGLFCDQPDICVVARQSL